MGNIVNSGDLRWGFPYLKPNGNEPAKYLYQIELDHEIPPGILFHDSLVSIAQANQKHPQGNTYSCYGTWIGRGVVWLYYPLEDLSEIKGLLSDEAALVSEHGEEKGKQINQAYRETLITDDKYTLEYVAKYSHPNLTPEPFPLEYIYYIQFDLDDTADTKEFDIAVEQIIQAHQKSDRGVHWVCYREMDSNKYHVFAPMREFGAMDEWAGMKEVLSIYDDKQARQIRDTFYAAIQQQKAQIMTFVPSCDNSGCDFIE